MATREKIKNPDGKGWAIYNYQDEDGNVAEKDEAVKYEAYEYDASGKLVGRSYGYKKGYTPPEEDESEEE